MTLATSIGRVVALVPGARRIKRRLFRSGRPTPFELPVGRPTDRGAPPRAEHAELAVRYHDSSISSVPDTFVLYRIIGNDLPPRHALGQSRKNLSFILEHEPDLPGCEKRFVVNRIVDPEEERAVGGLPSG